jgi:CheY-like chemotaxis protein
VRVLIAEDQKTVGDALADLVRHCQHEVVAVVPSGVEAVQAYTFYRPDVVLMDYAMPSLNGSTASRIILARHPAARIILVSGWSSIIDLKSAGAMTILAKPVRLKRLEEALNAAVQSSPK